MNDGVRNRGIQVVPLGHKNAPLRSRSSSAIPLQRSDDHSRTPACLRKISMKVSFLNGLDK